MCTSDILNSIVLSNTEHGIQAKPYPTEDGEMWYEVTIWHSPN